MNLYVTIEPCRKLKNLFSIISSFYVIDVDSILKSTGLDVTKETHQYLINTELKRLMVIGGRSKRYAGMIYINSIVSEDTMKSIRKSVDDMEYENVDGIVILDDYDVPKLKNLYKYADEVTFFPTLRKPKILKCLKK